MGYTHGKKWTNEKIKEEIFIVMKELEVERMPSASEMTSITGSSGLASKISRNGGFRYWANKLDIDMKQSDYNKGYKYEKLIKDKLEKLGYGVEIMTTKHPYDLLVNGDIKIDIKVSSLYSNKRVGDFHTFNLEKNKPTCDLYIAITLIDKKIDRIFIIPSKYLKITQLSVGKDSKYNKYIDKWDYINKYDNFYKNVI